MADRNLKRKSRPKKRQNATGSSDRPPPMTGGAIEPGKDNSEQEAAVKYEMEVNWCMEQLELGLESGKYRPDSRQAQDALKVLKVLQNPKAPLVKKRQVMRTTFGDYRKKMEEEAKKYAASVKKMKMESGAVTQRSQKSRFIRKAATSATTLASSAHQSSLCHQLQQSLNISTTAPSVGANVNKDSLADANTSKMEGDNVIAQKSEESIASPPVNAIKFVKSDNAFRFNFGTDIGTDTHGGGTEFAGSDDVSPVGGVGVSGKTGVSPAVNYYKLPKTDRCFQFNFPVSQS